MSYSTYPDRTPTTEVVNEILIERERQDAKWGEQNWPDHVNSSMEILLEMDLEANRARSRCQANHDYGRTNWADILLEEVFEALAESDPAKVRAELIQVAAVAANWVECIDRRTS